LFCVEPVESRTSGQNPASEKLFPGVRKLTCKTTFYGLAPDLREYFHGLTTINDTLNANNQNNGR